MGGTSKGVVETSDRDYIASSAISQSKVSRCDHILDPNWSALFNNHGGRHFPRHGVRSMYHSGSALGLPQDPGGQRTTRLRPPPAYRLCRWQGTRKLAPRSAGRRSAEPGDNTRVLPRAKGRQQGLGRRRKRRARKSNSRRRHRLERA